MLALAEGAVIRVGHVWQEVSDPPAEYLPSVQLCVINVMSEIHIHIICAVEASSRDAPDGHVPRKLLAPK